MAPFLRDGQIIVNVAKGVEEKTLLNLSQIIEQELPKADVSVLSGPSHAEEVGKGLPTTCVVSSHKRETAEYLQGIFMSPVFRVYTTPDMLGVELGAALKNVIALAAGTADGLGYGDNTKAALITRGIAEIARLGTKMGAKAETFYGLSGIGRSDRYLRKCPQQKPKSRVSDGKRLYHGRSHERSENGSGRCLFCKSCQRTG